MLTRLRRMLTDVNFSIQQNKTDITRWINFLENFIEEYRSEIYYYYTSIKVDRKNIEYIKNPYEHIHGELRVKSNYDKIYYNVYIYNCLDFIIDNKFEAFYCGVVYHRGFGIVLCYDGDVVGAPCISVFPKDILLSISRLLI